MKKLENLLITTIFFLLLTGSSFSQVEADSLKKNYISPKSIMIRSAILPGWGQWSNGKKIKSLLVASVESFLLYKFADNWQKYKNAENEWIKNQSEENEINKAFFENERSKFGWWFFLAYILSLMDAYVDAYLRDFNKNMDINYSTNITGFKVSLKF